MSDHQQNQIDAIVMLYVLLWFFVCMVGCDGYMNNRPGWSKLLSWGWVAVIGAFNSVLTLIIAVAVCG